MLHILLYCEGTGEINVLKQKVVFSSEILQTTYHNNLSLMRQIKDVKLVRIVFKSSQCLKNQCISQTISKDNTWIRAEP